MVQIHSNEWCVMHHSVWRTERSVETQPFVLRNSPSTWDMGLLHMIIHSHEEQNVTSAPAK